MYINQPAHWSDTWVRLKMGSECRQLWPFQYRGMMNRGANWDEDRNCGNLEPVRLWFLCLTWFSLHWNVPQAVLFLVDQLLDGENHSFTFALRRYAQRAGVAIGLCIIWWAQRPTITATWTWAQISFACQDTTGCNQPKFIQHTEVI